LHGEDWGQTRGIALLTVYLCVVIRFKKPAASIDAELHYAIEKQRLIEIRYKDRTRIAEPHDYGQQKGVDRLLIFQLIAVGSSPGHEVGWRLLDVPKIESLVVLDATFRGSRQERHQAHHEWDVLYARVR
jgi:hypothetical protein